MATLSPVQRRHREPTEPQFATVADGVRAQVVQRNILPPHLSAAAHEGRMAGCSCRPLLDQLSTMRSWVVQPRGTRAECTAGDTHHELIPLRVAAWPMAPLALRQQAYHQRVELTLTMCRWCGAVEVRDVSFHAPAGLRAGSLAPRRRSDILGWYAGSRPAGRTYS